MNLCKECLEEKVSIKHDNERLKGLLKTSILLIDQSIKDITLDKFIKDVKKELEG